MNELPPARAAWMEYANKNPNGYRFTTGPDGKPVLQSVSGYQRYTTPEGRLKSPGSNEYVITAVGELVEKTIVPVDKVFDLLKKKWETAGSASGLDPGSFRDCKVKFLKDYAGANGTDLEKIQELLLEVKRKQQVKADKIKPFNKPEPKEPKKRRPRNNTKLMTQKKPGETTHAKKWRSQMSSSLSGGLQPDITSSLAQGKGRTLAPRPSADPVVEKEAGESNADEDDEKSESLAKKRDLEDEESKPASNKKSKKGASSPKKRDLEDEEESEPGSNKKPKPDGKAAKAKKDGRK